MSEKLFIVFLTTDIQATVNFTPQEYVDNRYNECLNAIADHNVGFIVCRDICDAGERIKSVLLQNSSPIAIAINQNADSLGNFYDNTRNLYVSPSVFWEGAGPWQGLKSIVESEGEAFDWPIHIIASQPNGKTFAQELYKIESISHKLTLNFGQLSTAINETLEDME